VLEAAFRGSPPVVSVVVPTVGRLAYLDSALRSLVNQDASFAFEVIVVADGPAEGTADVAAQHGARLVRHEERRALNAARNTGVRASRAPLVAFVDDDVQASPGWLRAVVDGAARYPDADAFAGPIRPLFERPPPRGCGMDGPLVTSLDLGGRDRPTSVAWGANLAIRCAAFHRIGDFDETIR
jgi:glycosyltransferase involved in cell wall biosynthesis